MKTCERCNNKIQTKTIINGVTKYITTKHRKYCLDCSPFNNKRHYIGNNTIDEKVCRTCNKKLQRSQFYSISKNSVNVEPDCKECARKRTNYNNYNIKSKLVEYKGGKCISCGYNKCIYALEFHHKDPSMKEFSISQSKHRSIEHLKQEVDKCDLLCSNCHKEVHYHDVLREGNG